MKLNAIIVSILLKIDISEFRLILLDHITNVVLENALFVSLNLRQVRRSAMQGWKKVGNLGSSFPGNLTIWREIKSFHMKKYIRYSVKFVGNITIFPGRNLFQPCMSHVTVTHSILLNAVFRIIIIQIVLLCSHVLMILMLNINCLQANLHRPDDPSAPWLTSKR